MSILEAVANVVEVEELRAQLAHVRAQRDALQTQRDAALAGIAAALTFHSLPSLVSLDEIKRWRDMTGQMTLTVDALVAFLREKKAEATR